MFNIKKGIPTGKTRYNLALGEKLIKGKVVPCQKELRIIDSVLNMHEKEGLTATAMARVLNTMNILTKKRGETSTAPKNHKIHWIFFLFLLA